MTPRFSDQVLEVFDVPPNDYEFLASLLEKRTVSQHDLTLIFDQSLIAGVETWYHKLEHAFAPSSVSHSVENRTTVVLDEPWKATDLAIRQAQRLEREAFAGLITECDHVPTDAKKRKRVQKVAKRGSDGTVSQFWHQGSHTEVLCSSSKGLRQEKASVGSILGAGFLGANATAANSTCLPSCVLSAPRGVIASQTAHIDAGTSPYFTSSAPVPSQGEKKRRAPGTISCIPFPPLHAPSFGIIQEKVAHEPFWLLIVVTFLIKTSGRLAIPTFLRIKDKFPAPCDIANARNAAEILGMIQHLGLGRNRLRFIQKYAQAFIFDPPRPGVRYAVRGYDSGDAPENHDGLGDANGGGGGWEIGHLTQGKYAIDSWRIFCRDVLLGRASDWDGGGREPEFQPEWMRVLPADKELRAYLRWMWMKEGWEWDAATGERQVLREELCRAVNEGGVEYDDDGGLRILEVGL